MFLTFLFVLIVVLTVFYPWPLQENRGVSYKFYESIYLIKHLCRAASVFSFWLRNFMSLLTLLFSDVFMGLRSKLLRWNGLRPLLFKFISPYSVRMPENTDQKKLRIWTLFTQLTSLLMNINWHLFCYKVIETISFFLDISCYYLSEM